MNLKTHILRQPCGRNESAVALVITLLMLSIITFLAIAFLAMTARDKSAVTATLDVDTARSMSDAALSRAQTEIIAQMMIPPGDILRYDYMASHNYITPATLFSAADTTLNDPNNVNYDVLLASGGTANSYWAQNIGNLFFDPRPPVFVPTNAPNGTQSNDFRYWVDINRNGSFESNGLTQELDVFGNVITGVSNFYNGEPEWIGVLKYPEYIHSWTNPFVGRYAYMVLPIGKTLDWNFIHNYSKFLGTVPTGTSYDGFVRDEGAGSWELNLAALLNDTSATMYQDGVGDGNYNYNLNGPAPNFPNNSGNCFDDAEQFVAFRYLGYNNTTTYPQSLVNVFGTNLPAMGVTVVDEYGQFPSTTYPFDYNQNPPTTFPTAKPWPGSYNTNLFYDVQDLFDPTKTGVNNAGNVGSFGHRLASVMTNLDSYDRYTFQRLLATIGTSSSPEYGVYVYSNFYTANPYVFGVPGFLPIPLPSVMRTKVNINYDNTAQIQAGPTNSYGMYTPMPTNLVPWTAIGFFTNAADLLLRSQIFVYTNYVTNLGGTTAVPIGSLYVPVGTASNFVFTSFGLTNIQVYNYTNPGICYNEQVHRMLQLAANIYAAAYPSYAGSGLNLVQHPPIFRPQFLITKDPSGTSNLFVTITNFVQVTNNGYSQLFKGFYDLTNSTAANPPQPDPNLWGIPWIVGAVKGLPAFDQYSYQNQVHCDRQLQFIRYPGGSPGPYKTGPGSIQYMNQFYDFGTTNNCGFDAWNPYSTSFAGSGNGLYAMASYDMRVTLTNNYNWGTNIPVTNYFPTPFPVIPIGKVWLPGAFQTFLPTNFSALPYGYFSESLLKFIPLTNINGYSTDTNQTIYQTHKWTATVSNHVYYALFDGQPSSGASLLDFVNMGPFGSSFNLSQTLTNTDQFLSMWGSSNASDAGNTQIPSGVLAQIYNGYGLSTQFQDSMVGTTGGYPASTGRFVSPGLAPKTPQAQAGAVVPYANYSDSNIWMACDPLVHYTAGDLFSSSPKCPSTAIINVMNPLLALGTSTGSQTMRYKNGILNTIMLYGDPGINSSDSWQFPTNLFPGVGWLGRVHRGTPWQTIYLKSDSQVQTETAGWGTHTIGNTPWVHSAFTYPTNDWSIVDLFTAVPNDNAARGLLSVNQTNDAAWAAVFAGVIALTNATGGIPISPTNDAYNFYNLAIDGPAGMNVTRFTNFNQLFHHVGDILQVSTLTRNSPYLPASGLTDEMVERIPQQTLSLLKVGLPQFVIYSWGQSLKPKSLYSGGPASLTGICTNYEITGEFLTRTVCHIVGDPAAAAPKIVVDNYNIEPGN